MDNKNQLVEYLQYIKQNNKNYYAIHFHFSKLHQNNKSEYRIKIATNIINVFFRDHPINLFVLDDSDIIVIYKNRDELMLKKVIFELRYLFIDDKLAFISEGVENSDFCSSYDLLEDLGQFFSSITDEDHVNTNYNNRDKSIVEVNARSLAMIENDIMNTQISSLMRTQNIIALSNDSSFRIIFYEIYVSISHLCNLFNYQIKVNPNSLLFRHLTHILDGQVLSTLEKKISNYVDKSISINLNVETILSDKFHNFDNSIHQTQKNSIIIEINIADVFVDISAFIAARQFLQKKGYRVCLDGLNDRSLVQVDRESLGFDLIKVHWNADTKSDLVNKDNSKLIEAVKTCGSHRIILCRCDNEEAIEYGRALGISLFQGWHIDKLTKDHK